MKKQSGFANPEAQIAVAGVAIYVAVVIPILVRSRAQALDVGGWIWVGVKVGWPLVVLPLVALGLYWSARSEAKGEGEPVPWRWSEYFEQLLFVLVSSTLLAFVVGVLWFVWSLF